MFNCDCHIFMCEECAKRFQPFEEPLLGGIGRLDCRWCGKEVLMDKDHRWALVPKTRIREVVGVIQAS